MSELENNYKWINPIGGLGDMLMLSGVLKKVIETFPERKYNMVQRTRYNSFFKNHPAIHTIGIAPKDAEIIEVNYWSIEKLGADNQRPFQILSRAFGLTTPQEEVLFYPGSIDENDMLFSRIPWGSKNVLIAPNSDSPRKMLNPHAWQYLVEQLKSKDIFVLQVGQRHETLIKGAYSLMGLTSISQLIPIIKKVELIITSDNFIMHLAKLYNKKAIVIWGPTKNYIYGYPSQTHFQAPDDFCEFKNKCIGAEVPENYIKPCPLKENHCLNKININDVIFKSLESIS
jgi:ADP-heptose:LPS heptosyltransferase